MWPTGFHGWNPATGIRTHRRDIGPLANLHTIKSFAAEQGRSRKLVRRLIRDLGLNPTRLGGKVILTARQQARLREAIALCREARPAKAS